MTEFLMTFLLNAFWQTALIILAAMIGTWLLRDAGSRSKHVVWVAALFLSLTLPLLTAIWFNAPEMTGHAETTAVSQVHFEQVGRIDFEASLSDEPVAPTLPSTIPVSTGLAFGILALYGLFVIYRVSALVNALVRTSAIRRRAKASELPENIIAAIAQCSDVITARQISVLFSSEVSVPVTVGWLRPVIILPETFLREIDANVLTTALGHEMVHVARRDYAVNLLLEIVSLPISFHPAVAYAKRRIAQMRELCCDEVVASRLLNADIYARSLLNIAGSASPLDRLSPMITVGITDNKNLEVRIMSLLKRSEMSRFKKGVLALAALAVLAIPLVVAAYLSPDVTITSAALPEAQPTVPVETEGDQDKASRTELETQLVLARKLVERKLVEIKTALADPNLTDVQRVVLTIKIRKIETELSEIDQVVRVERLKRQLTEVATGLQDPNLSEERRNEFRAMEAKVRNELQGIESGRRGVVYGKSGEVIHVIDITSIGTEDDDEWDYPPDMDMDMDSPRSRKAMERLKKEACITMEEASQRALASYPGKLIEKELGQIKGEVVYRFFIIDEAATSDSNALMVHVSGIDGRIIKTARSHVTVNFTDGNERVTFTRKGKKPE